MRAWIASLLILLMVPCLLYAQEPGAIFDGLTPTSSSDTVGRNLGTVETFSVAGLIPSIRFWKLVGDPGPHIGRLWSTAGVLLAQVTFTNETASGWQEQALPTPYAVSGKTTVVVTVTNPAGSHFAVLANAMGTTGIVTGVATATSMYGGSSDSFPTLKSPHAYFRDARFLPAVPSVTITTDATGVLTATLQGFAMGTYSLSVGVSDETGQSVASTVTPLVLGR